MCVHHPVTRLHQSSSGAVVGGDRGHGQLHDFCVGALRTGYGHRHRCRATGFAWHIPEFQFRDTAIGLQCRITCLGLSDRAYRLGLIDRLLEKRSGCSWLHAPRNLARPESAHRQLTTSTLTTQHTSGRFQRHRYPVLRCQAAPGAAEGSRRMTAARRGVRTG